MNATHVRPCRDLRNNYPELARIAKEHDHVIITNNGKGDTVLIGFEDYEAYQEFLYARYVSEKLKEAEEEAGKPDAVWLSLGETMKRIRASL